MINSLDARVTILESEVAEGSAETLDIPIVAAESIPAFSPVKINGLIANSATPADNGRLAGIASTSIVSGFTGNVRKDGLLVTSLTLTPNLDVFVNGTSLSNTPPTSGWVQKVGLAKSVNTILIEIGPAILL